MEDHGRQEAATVLWSCRNVNRDRRATRLQQRDQVVHCFCLPLRIEERCVPGLVQRALPRLCRCAEVDEREVLHWRVRDTFQSFEGVQQTAKCVERLIRELLDKRFLGETFEVGLGRKVASPPQR